MNLILQVVNWVLAIGGLIYFIHGASQTGIINGWLVLDRDAWDDPRKGQAFLIIGGVVLIVAAISIAGTRIDRQLQRLTERERE